MVTINRMLNRGDLYEETNTRLYKELALTDSLCNYLKEVSFKKDTIINLEVEKFRQASEVNESLKTALIVEKNKNRKNSLRVGVGGTLLGVLLGVLIIK